MAHFSDRAFRVVSGAIIAAWSVMAVQCVNEQPRDAGGNGVEFSEPNEENSTYSPHVSPGHGGPNPGQGPGGEGPPGQDKDKSGKPKK